MTSNTRTADQIERDISKERSALSDTLHDLQDKFSVKTIVNDIGDMVRDQGGDLGRAVSDTVARNPAAVVLTTVGLAWLFLGQGNKPRRARTPASDYDWSDQGRGHRAAKSVDIDDDTMWQMISHSAATVSDKASELKERLTHGLEDLSEEAKARVLAAREAAHDARQASQEAMQKNTRRASDFFDEQPLVAGALAVAVGAAIGGLIPHTRLEDDTLGATSDKLYADAQALYREERDKVRAAAKVAVADVKDEVRKAGDDLQDMLSEGKNVGDVIADRTADAAKRVIDHATDATEGKPVGNGNTQA
ncbi:MAG: DUF3618 domain-containing protein [Loktanella sp.]|nr:DUF3618 domain-containing protein [Loktanella sp.]